MSSKSTIFLTNDKNEHSYFDSSECYQDKGGDRKHAITIEFDKSNIRIDMNDDEAIVLTITNVDSELYKIFSQLGNVVPDENK